MEDIQIKHKSTSNEIQYDMITNYKNIHLPNNTGITQYQYSARNLPQLLLSFLNKYKKLYFYILFSFKFMQPNLRGNNFQKKNTVQITGKI